MMDDNKILDRFGIAKINERLLNRLIDSRPAKAYNYGIRMTSGTSGGDPVISVLEYGEWQHEIFFGDERIISCIGSRNGQLAKIVHLRKQKNDYPQRILAFDIKDIREGLQDIVLDFSPDTITGTVSLVCRLSEYFYPIDGEKIKTLKLGGERITLPSLSVLQPRFPKARLLMNYSISELGPVGFSCENLFPNQYHPTPGVKIEIVNKDSAGVGDIILDKIMPDGLLIKNYSIGDSGCFLLEECICGEKIIFEHFGRIGFDYIKIAGALLKQDEIDRISPLFMRFMDDYRIEAGEVVDGGRLKGKLTLRAYSKSGPPTDGIVREIARNFSDNLRLTPTRTLSDLALSGDFVPLTVEYSSTLFISSNKNVKILRIIS